MLAVLFPLLLGCVPLEERIVLAYETWCDTARSVSVDCVYDGDTFYLGGCGGEATEDIRLLGVQAPELTGGDQDDGTECYGPEAAAFLEDLLLGERVRLEFDVECEGVYGRTLAWVTLEGDDPDVLNMLDDLGGIGLTGEGTYEVLVNELMVRAGYATLYTGEVDQSIRYEGQMEQAEEDAAADRAGLWGSCD